MIRLSVRLTLAALSVTVAACTGGCNRGGHASDSPTEQERLIAGYVVSKSFVGGSAGIIIDDGRAFAFEVGVGATTYKIAPQAYQQLAEGIADAGFFAVPKTLHVDDFPDGNEIFLTVATNKAEHTSVNYMDPNNDFAATLRVVSKLAPPPVEGAAQPVAIITDALRAYTSQATSAEKRRAVASWLTTVAPLLEQHQAQSQP
jgi:hypothetical protein